jgi:hypothetical protein
VQDGSEIGRRLLFATAALAAALCLCAAAEPASQVNGLTINVTYTATSIQAKLSNGTALAQGAVVPPGPYSIVVYDAGDYPTPAFAMSGPTVAVSSDLSPNGTIEVPMTFGPFLLQPSSSYEISDTNQGSTISFTTAATGTSASPDATTTTATKTLGASSLALLVGANGKPVLTLGGKPVKTLVAGKYSAIVADQSTKVGLLLGHGTAKPVTLSGAAATGATPRRLTLTRGRWFFETSTRGPKTYFTVS